MKTKNLFLILTALGAITLGGCNSGGTTTTSSEPTTTEAPTTEPTTTTTEHVHEYEFDSFVWDTSVARHWTAKAKLVCKYDPTHISYVDDVARAIGELTPTCTPGRMTYEAKYLDHEERNFEELPPVDPHIDNAYGFCMRCRGYVGTELDMKDEESVTFTLNGVEKDKTYFYMVKNLNPNETYRSQYLGEGTTDVPVENVTSTAFVRVAEDVKLDTSFEAYPEAKINASGSELKYSQVNYDALYFSFKASVSTTKTINIQIDTCHYLDPHDELSAYGFCRAGEYCGDKHESGEVVNDITVEASKTPLFHSWNFGEHSGTVGLYAGFTQEATTVSFYILKENNKMELLLNAGANCDHQPKTFEGSVDGIIYGVFKTTSSEYMDVPIAFAAKLDEHFFSIGEREWFFGGYQSISSDFELSSNKKTGNTWYTCCVSSTEVDASKTYTIETSSDEIKNGIKVYQKIDGTIKEITVTDNKFSPEKDNSSLYFEITSEANLNGQKFSLSD